MKHPITIAKNFLYSHQKNTDTLNNLDSIFSEIKDAIVQTKRNTDELVFASYFHDTIKHSEWFDEPLSLSSGAIGYNFAYILYRALDDVKPQKILELGLGQSTKIINAYAKHFKNIEHHIIEHDQNWIDFFKKSTDISEMANIHLLENYKRHYRNTELNAYKDFAKNLSKKKFDLIVIDGPVGVGQEYSRMDTLSIIPECLPSTFVILLDDCERIGEQRTIQLLEEKLKKNHIPFYSGYQYKGINDAYICVSEDLKFLCHI